eukprot:660776-Hanusia_phi.AAC.1
MAPDSAADMPGTRSITLTSSSCKFSFELVITRVSSPIPTPQGFLIFRHVSLLLTSASSSASNLRQRVEVLDLGLEPVALFGKEENFLLEFALHEGVLGDDLGSGVLAAQSRLLAPHL